MKLKNISCVLSYCVRHFFCKIEKYFCLGNVLSKALYQLNGYRLRKSVYTIVRLMIEIQHVLTPFLSLTTGFYH